MARKVCATVFIFLAWSIYASGLSSHPESSQKKASRDQAEKAVRTSIYEMMRAFLTVDVKALKQRSARRTLDLVNLVYEAAQEEPRLQEELRNARVTNSDEFMRFFVQGMANQYLQALPMAPEQAARKVAHDAVVSFTSDSEATIIVNNAEFARAKLVAKEWKIDLTDSLKKAVLNEVKNPTMRAKIKNL
ncbi:MAG TPA: hypothetical protein VNS63_02145 [Blastocatellia bacterium]|nr:hypothetical protein [Blastocatellia bacterium]